MADGVNGLQIQWIIALVKAKLFRLANVIILLPGMEENLVQVPVSELLIATNANATRRAVIRSVRKPPTDTTVYAMKNIKEVEVHVLVCDYKDLTDVVFVNLRSKRFRRSEKFLGVLTAQKLGREQKTDGGEKGVVYPWDAGLKNENSAIIHFLYLPNKAITIT